MNQNPATVLICPGQGAQRAGGVTDLAESFDDLPEAGQSTFRLASEIVGCDLWQLGLSARQADEAALRQPSLLQPFLVAWAVAEYAAIAQRIGPLSVVTGHSSGMNSALVLSGAVDLEAALEFAWQCGRNMDRDCQERPGGLLALVGAGRSAAETIAAQTGASLANHNAPDQTVLGGAHDALARATTIAPEFGGQPVQLRVAGAFHTSAFERSDALNRGLIDALPIANGFTPIIGNHSGQIVKSAEQLREELRSQYVRAVEWQSVLNTLYELGVRRYLTLGPGNVMAGLVRRYGKTLPQRIEIRRTSQLRS
ncbi:MAG: ACP S-malonyltransferase [Chloroflexota bacterium]|nr:ACP S-malonyltransferase [Chloroflexota bacterium]MDE2895930.1 ACP S-malonyltransferase [Chloroflexota bacterium]